MVDFKSFKTGGIVLDDRYSPILIGTFFGEVDLEAARWHDEVHTRAILHAASRGQKVISISDSTFSTKPSPEVRKFWAENGKKTSPTARATLIGTFVVIKNPLIRGVITALGWMNEEMRAVEVFDSLEAALTEAKKRLVVAGNAVPLDPKRYELPREAASMASAGRR